MASIFSIHFRLVFADIVPIKESLIEKDEKGVEREIEPPSHNAHTNTVSLLLKVT